MQNPAKDSDSESIDSAEFLKLRKAYVDNLYGNFDVSTSNVSEELDSKAGSKMRTNEERERSFQSCEAGDSLNRTAMQQQQESRKRKRGRPRKSAGDAQDKIKKDSVFVPNPVHATVFPSEGVSYRERVMTRSQFRKSIQYFGPGSQGFAAKKEAGASGEGAGKNNKAQPLKRGQPPKKKGQGDAASDEINTTI